MIINRVPPYPLSVTYDVPQEYTDYIFTIENAPITIEAEAFLTSDENSQITFILNGEFLKYDHNYSVIVYEDNYGDRGEVVVEDILNIMRPYVNPKQLGTTPSEITEYIEHEQLARAIIDSVVGPKGFIFEKALMEVVGQGTDYLPLWDLAYKILQVYENGELVYDSSLETPALKDFNYGITQDRSAIYKEYVDEQASYNRAEKKPLKYPFALSDSFTGDSIKDSYDSAFTILPTQGIMFPEGWDYVIIYEAGHRVVPHDIRDATARLIEDIKCGRLDYYKKFITNYRTEQFQITFDSKMFEGTGNILVDKALDKYITNIRKPGIL
jgi:hypothetical protein